VVQVCLAACRSEIFPERVADLRAIPAVIAAVPRQRLPKKAIDEDAASSPIWSRDDTGALHNPTRGVALSSWHSREQAGEGQVAGVRSA